MTQINYEKLIGQWHLDRNLIEGSTDKDQYMKLIQEVGELSDSLCKSKDFRDDVFHQLPESLRSKLPEVPEKGDLDIEQLKDCDFFFA